MNSRERVLRAINHKEPDRIPIDLGATNSSGISAIAYNNLKKYLSLENGHNRVYDVVQQLAQPEEEILDMFGVDTLDIGRAFNPEDEDWYEVSLPDNSRAEYPSWFRPVITPHGLEIHKDGTLIGRMPNGATFFDQVIFPYVDSFPKEYNQLSTDIGKVIWSLPQSPWNHLSDSNFWETFRAKAIELRKKSERALVFVCGGNLFEWGTFLRRMDNFLVDLYLSESEVERFLDAIFEVHMDTLQKVCKAIGDVADIIRLGGDLGMDSGPLIPPELYRKYFKPRHKLFCEYVKKHSQMHILIHTCGSVYKIIPDLIEAGFEILNPVQTNCRDMEPEKLKKEFGKYITFWGGGCDTRHILNRGTPQEVKDDVKRRLEIFAKGGGFVFNTIHNILPDVPPENPENIVAMFESVMEFAYC